MHATAAPPVRPDGLQMEDHRRYQERLWTAERCAWVFFVLFALAALLGVTGAGGPLSRHQAVTAAGEIDLPRVARWQTPDHMVVRFAAGGGHTLLLSPQFSHTFQVEAIRPEPERVVSGPNGHTVHLAGGDGPAEAFLYLRPQGPGRTQYSIALDGAPPVSLSTLTLP